MCCKIHHCHLTSPFCLDKCSGDRASSLAPTQCGTGGAARAAQGRQVWAETQQTSIADEARGDVPHPPLPCDAGATPLAPPLRPRAQLLAADAAATRTSRQQPHPRKRSGEALDDTGAPRTRLGGPTRELREPRTSEGSPQRAGRRQRSRRRRGDGHHSGSPARPKSPGQERAP